MCSHSSAPYLASRRDWVHTVFQFWLPWSPGEASNLPEPPIAHLYNENSDFHICELLWTLNEMIMYAEHFENCREHSSRVMNYLCRYSGSKRKHSPADPGWQLLRSQWSIGFRQMGNPIDHLLHLAAFPTSTDMIIIRASRVLLNFRRIHGTVCSLPEMHV